MLYYYFKSIRENSVKEPGCVWKARWAHSTNTEDAAAAGRLAYNFQVATH